MIDLPHTIDLLAEAQARQTAARLEMAVAEKELHVANAAWIGLSREIRTRWMDAHQALECAQADETQAASQLDGLLQ